MFEKFFKQKENYIRNKSGSTQKNGPVHGKNEIKYR